MTEPEKVWKVLKRKFGIDTVPEGDEVGIKVLAAFKRDVTNETIRTVKKWVRKL